MAIVSALSSGVDAIGCSPPFKTQKTICREANGPSLLKMVLMNSEYPLFPENCNYVVV